jgi:ubiquinone/menaquinone biosynthesis C-methylase UbiE
MSTPTSSNASEGEIRFVADTESGGTMTWLLNADKIVNNGMGGTLSERPDLSGIRDILDLACGPGGWVLEVAREHPDINVIGVDISKSMIEFAQAQATSRGYGNAGFIVADIKQPLPFEDESFDLVNERTIYGVMGPGEWPQLLAECKRVLRPGGIIRLTELEMPVTTSRALNELWYISTMAFYKKRRTFSVDGRHVGINPVLKRLLREAGFQNVKHQGHVIDISAGTPDFEGFWRHFVYVIELVKPFMLKVEGLTTEQEYDRLYQEMQAEMLASDYCGMWTYVTAWGEKPR